MTDGIPTPITYKQAVCGPEAKEWKVAMDSKYQKLQNLGTYELAKIDEKSNVVKCKWVYKKKLDVKGRVLEFKAQLVAKGFTQRFGIDFYETFAPVAKIKVDNVPTETRTLWSGGIQKRRKVKRLSFIKVIFAIRISRNIPINAIFHDIHVILISGANLLCHIIVTIEKVLQTLLRRIIRRGCNHNSLANMLNTLLIGDTTFSASKNGVRSLAK